MSVATDVEVRDEIDVSHSDEVPCESRKFHQDGDRPPAEWKIEVRCPACYQRFRGKHCNPCTCWFMHQQVFTCSCCYVTAYTERWEVSLCPLMW